MKKVTILIILLTYGAASMGATMHMHYCMNKLVGWSFWHGEKDKKCSKCGMKDKKAGCCKDEHKQVKLKTEQHKTTTAQYIQFLGVPALITPIADFSLKGTPISLAFPLSNAPSEILGERLYILHCVYLI